MHVCKKQPSRADDAGCCGAPAMLLAVLVHLCQKQPSSCCFGALVQEAAELVLMMLAALGHLYEKQLS